MKTLFVVVLLSFAGCSSEPGSTPDNTTSNPNAETGAVEFLNLRVEDIGPNRAVARFETSIPTSCEADYGEADDALDKTATDPNMAEGELSETHEVPFEDLTSGTKYFWRAKVEDDNGTISYSEVLSFDTLLAALNNVALDNMSLSGAVSAVSSNFGGGANDSTWGADNAFDGQMSTEWASDGDGDDAMIAIDLGAVREISHFAFRSRKMSDGTSIIEQVQLRFDGGDPVGPFDTPNPDERYLFELDAPQSGQVITVEALQTTGGNTGAKEIEFLGEL